MDYKFLDTDKAVIKYLNDLEESSINEIGVDFEADFNLHAYGEKLCLIQLYDGRIPVVIDPMKIDPMITKPFFESRKIAKIMFDSSSDQRLLYKLYKIRIHNIIDLKPAVNILQYPKLNLGYLLTEKIGLPPFNKKAFQQYNWLTRPIDKKAMDYAISDVLYLFELRQMLFNEMAEKGLMIDYLGKNSSMQESAPRIDNKHSIFRKLLYSSLGKTQRKIFQEIFWIRDKYAKRLDLPPYLLFSNEKMRKLCTRPETVHNFKTRKEIDILEMEKLRSEIEQVHYKYELEMEQQFLSKDGKPDG